MTRYLEAGFWIGAFMGIPPWPVFIVASGGDCHGAAIGLAIQFSGICLQLFFFRMVIEHE